MIRPSRSALTRMILVTALLSVMVFASVVLVVPSSQAAPASNCTYYSNASKTTVVGKFGRDCCNNPVAWGVKTAYKTCGGCFVCFPPNP